MKKIYTLFSILLISLCIQAQPSFTPEQREVQQAVVRLFDALSARDSVSLKNTCTADITLYEYGQVWTIDTLISKAIVQNQAADFARTNQFEFISTITAKDMAWASYRLSSVIIRDGKTTTVQWLETIIAVRERKQWKVQHLHSTLLKRN